MPEDCGNHGCLRNIKAKPVCICSGIVVVVLIVVVFLIHIPWLWPTRPRFILQDVTVFVFNLSSPHLLTTTFQITISARNPNPKTGIYYDYLHVYASYMDQQITFPTTIPPTYQEHKEHNVWSPFVYGTSVSIAPLNGAALSCEQNGGLVALMICADGRVRWKFWIVSRRSHLSIRCPAYINPWNQAAGTIVGENAVKYTLATKCSVSVSV
ncbi:PREDICTED: NDR1/HIN1-like protein 12 [Tarenaya hassleriana]|uniref:NDR1/HIN1-like protein 12 n=1 Tax=Tarenaya hassleriana TaxID=28532 RepID=UPI00053C3E81|nr:PREDICTED: NDR1/HIN1-like protein 12 [Tarenaya hassleriana]